MVLTIFVKIAPKKISHFFPFSRNSPAKKWFLGSDLIWENLGIPSGFYLSFKKHEKKEFYEDYALYSLYGQVELYIG